LHWSVLLLITIAVGSVGAFTGLKLRMPAGAMVGAMVTVIIFNLLTGLTAFPRDVRVVVQMFSGAVIALRVAKEDILHLKVMGLPVIVLLTSMMILSVVLGLTIYSVSELDVTTALFASTPGGMTDMAMIAGDLGANPSYVVILQLCRQIFTLSLLPPIFARILKKKQAKEQTLEVGSSTVKAAKAPKLPLKQAAPRWIITSLAAVAGGFLFNYLDIPAGAILGGMVATVALNMTWGKCAMPSKTRRVLQTLSGCYIGTTLTMEYVYTLPQLIVPVCIMAVCVFIWCFGVGFVIHKITKLDFETCMVACAPGGIQDMCLLADELGLDASKVALMQTCRIAGTIAFFPTMLLFVRGFFL